VRPGTDSYTASMSRRAARAWILVVVLAFAGIATVSILRLSRDAGTATADLPRSDPAPDFQGIAGWVNSPPLALAGLHGKVVLIDFWTYSCINCIRTFPGLKTLYAKYMPVGLEIVGMHAPEFDFERSIANVRRAVAEHGITWPVALDNAMTTWRAYRNQYWPHLYLIDQQGRIRFDHIGEGGEDLVEAKIRALLAAGGTTLPPDEVMPQPSIGADITREIYLGFDRGSVERSLASREGYHSDEAFTYAPPSAALVSEAGTDGVFFLAGRWLARGEYVRAERGPARITFRFKARDVYFVAAPVGVKEVSARLKLDGKPLDEGRNGGDVKAGVVRVGAQTLYHLVHLNGVESHQLEIASDGPGLAVYTFTFG
jgi:thiol-disulfide isomerase/thioredoxin